MLFRMDDEYSQLVCKYHHSLQSFQILSSLYQTILGLKLYSLVLLVLLTYHLILFL